MLSCNSFVKCCFHLHMKYWPASTWQVIVFLKKTWVLSTLCLTETIKSWYFFIELKWFLLIQKQPSGGVLSKRYSEDMLQMYREHPCRSVISIIESALRHGCSPVNLMNIFRTPFYKNTSKWLLLLMSVWSTLNVKYCSFTQHNGFFLNFFCFTLNEC